MSSTEHIEVAPRMWDKTIAAPYTPGTKPAAEAPPEQSAERVVVPAVGLLYKLKTYLLPVVFVLALIVVIYILWKYFTKYRKQKAEAALMLGGHTSPQADNPLATIEDDTSKYECGSDSDESEDEAEDEAEGEAESEDGSVSEESDTCKLSTIEEIDEDALSGSEDEEDEEDEVPMLEDTLSGSEEEEQDEVPVLEDTTDDVPDIQEIENMLARDMEADDDQDMDAMFNLPTYEDDSEEKEDTEAQDKTTQKKSRRMRHVTV